uniref:Uncharacterized protein n=1 Tax=Ciona intestinalis TaxID=7719 RepID=H2XQG0_CIOIN
MYGFVSKGNFSSTPSRLERFSLERASALDNLFLFP